MAATTGTPRFTATGCWSACARLFPKAAFAADARRAALAKSLTPANIAQEVKYLNAEGRTSFERPYGLPGCCNSPPS